MTSLTYVKGFIVDSVTGIRDEVDILLTDIKNEKSDHRHALIVGGAAGNFTVTGIDVGDKLDEVLLYHVTAGDLDSIFGLDCRVHHQRPQHHQQHVGHGFDRQQAPRSLDQSIILCRNS